MADKKSDIIFLWMFGYRPFFRSERQLTASRSTSSPSPVCAGVCERVHGYPTFPSLPGTLRYLHSAAFSSGEHRSGPPSRLCPRCPVVWGQAASLSYLRDPHASQDKASLIPRRCGSVMLIQLPTGRETQLVCLVDLFQMYCMLYLPLVINKHRWNSSQQKWKIILLLTNCHYFYRFFFIKHQKSTDIVWIDWNKQIVYQ